MSNEILTPYYIMHESKLRRNLNVISEVARKADVEIILAFKAFALWKTFGIFREYIKSTTASSPFEALLAKKEFDILPIHIPRRTNNIRSLLFWNARSLSRSTL